MWDTRTLWELAGRTNDAGNTGSGAMQRMYPLTPWVHCINQRLQTWKRWALYGLGDPAYACSLVMTLLSIILRQMSPVSREFIFSNIMTNKEKWGNLWSSSGRRLPPGSCFSETWANVCQGQALCLWAGGKATLSEFPRRHMSPRVMQCQPWLPYWANV